MSARVVINNNTQHVVHVVGCISLFGIVLGNDTVKPDSLWRACAQRFAIPIGESSYPVTVEASYQSCSNDPAQSGLPACGPNGSIAALPPGEYQAQFQQSSKIATTPQPISVHVTAQPPPRP